MANKVLSIKMDEKDIKKETSNLFQSEDFTQSKTRFLS